MKIAKLVLTFCLLSVTGLAMADETAANTAGDPYENFNRHAYKLNDRLDRAILKPIAQGYVFVMPKIGQKGVHNFFNNLRLIPSFINDILQGEIIQAASDGWRFVINSTVGVAGFLDVATYMDLPLHSTDLGITFAKWGWTNSNYFVLPFWGPSTVRDTVALPFYLFMTVYPYIRPIGYAYGAAALDIIDQRAQLLDLDDVAKKAALDPYAFQRDAYLQRRASIINPNSETSNKDLYDELEDDDFDDDLEEDEAPAAKAN